MHSDTDEETDKSKKRSCPESWARNLRKKARTAGVPYLNSKNQFVPGKSIGPKCKCKKKCLESIPQEQRIEAFQRFLSLKTKDEQDIFLQNLIRRSTPKRRRPRKNEPSSRLYYQFYILVGSLTKEVCRSTFLSIYSISLKRLKRLNELAKTGTSHRDLRGQGRKANIIPPEGLQKIDNHIRSFPTEQSHYCGKFVNYLDSRLNMKIMWELFKKKHKECKVGYNFYARFFKNNFDLKFNQPQVDVCCQCEMLKSKIKNSHVSEAARRKAEEDLSLHQRRAEKFYINLREESKVNADPTVASLAFDYMQNLSIPVIPVQDSYYLSKIKVNVFSIHNIKNNTSKFYIYHEGIAKKGPNEVCSFLSDYVQNELTSDVKTLKLFCDNCSGQNKNHLMSKLLIAFVELNRFQKIDQYFPVMGHSFLPCDRDFSLIKRKLKRRNRIYSMKQIVKAIITSCGKIDRFQVKVVSTSDIVDFKSWWPEHYKRNVISMETVGKKAKKEDKIHFSISSYNYVVYNADIFGALTAYHFIDEATKHTFLVRKPMKEESRNVIPLPSTIAYPSGFVPILKSKIEDLKKLGQYIPQKYQNYYQSLVQWPTCESREDDYDEN